MKSYTGFGTANEVSIQPGVRGSDTTIACWLLQGQWHPHWHQFVLSVVHLRELEGWPPPKLDFPEATHELLVMAIDPSEEPCTVEELESGQQVKFLMPIDVAEQFIATDEEMVRVTDLCAQACMDGRLNPSTDDARTFLREQWRISVQQTLEHFRGEHG